MKEVKTWKPYLYGGLSGLLLTLSVALRGQFFGTSTTFPRFATLILDTVGIDLSFLAFYQAGNGNLTGDAFPNWQLLFVLGIGLGAFISSKLTGTYKREEMPPVWEQRFGTSKSTRIWYSLAAGAAAMVGVRMAGGCTSGHGVSGISALGLGSLFVVAVFFASGMITARLVYGRR